MIPITYKGAAGTVKAGERIYKEELKRARKFDLELQDTLSRFRQFRHELIEKATGSPVQGSHVSTDYPIYRSFHPSIKSSVIKEIAVLPPQEPIKLPKGASLVLEDLPKFKEPIVSPKMQKNLRILDLRIDPEGYLYSTKAYNSNWEWQSQAIWLRTIGIGRITISKRLNKSIKTVDKMFGRLKSLTKFYRPIFKHDWTNIGREWVGSEGHKIERRLMFGGVKDEVKYLDPDETDTDNNNEDNIINDVINFRNDIVIRDERQGTYRLPVKIGFSMGNRFTSHDQPKTGEFSLKEHKRDIKKRSKEARKTKLEMIREQKRIEQLGRESMAIE